ncbi:MAG TPA: hypothetical protein IAB26_09510 [Candidatus Limivivens merdigallinarum]|uniref:Uncharacterized protein n=1 Tax=Candidatus Limivivens merdigallinarum TaxID=2840859 RepID=A0A9D1D166_9FIRM|nr:hypothetical protein [Candidatus Limivivens merdigallinarum]
MKRLLGYTLFWVGMGMLLSFFVPGPFLSVCLTAGLLIVGYLLFCSR